MSRSRSGLTVTLIGLITALAGCAGNPSGPRVVPVSGRVEYRGQPVAGAIVTFSHTAPNLAAFATTDSDGRYVLTTRTTGDGALPGPHAVSVWRADILNPDPSEADKFAASREPPPPKLKWLVPERYGHVTTSGLSFTVPDAGTSDANLTLTD